MRFASFNKGVYLENFDNSNPICKFSLLKQGLEAKILALKIDLIKVIDDKICCSNINYDSFVSETVHNVCNIRESIIKQINKLKNENPQNLFLERCSGPVVLKAKKTAPVDASGPFLPPIWIDL